MYIVDHDFPSRTAPAPDLSTVPSEQKYMGADQYQDEGRFRSARDYPIGVYSYLAYAEVEKIAHNAANYDAAEVLDMN